MPRLYEHCEICGNVLGPRTAEAPPHVCDHLAPVVEAVMAYKRPEDLTIRGILAQSVPRALRWHNGDLGSWSLLEWAGAMAGEAGESVNYAKKLKRVDSGLRNVDQDEPDNTAEILKGKVAWEAADTFLYSLLVMAQTAPGGDVDKLIRMVFNAKSAEYGFPEQI